MNSIAMKRVQIKSSEENKGSGACVMIRFARRGQSTMEYAIFFAVVAAAVTTMSLYVQRSIQARLKGVEDHVNAEALLGP